MRLILLFFAVVGIVAIFSDDVGFINKAKNSTQNGLARIGSAVESVSDGTSKMWDKFVDSSTGDYKE